MGLTCTHCGAKNEVGREGARAASCAACGEVLRDGAGGAGPRGREYDGYAVGRRVLRLAPAWLLLTVAGFVLALLLFSWAKRTGGDAARGEPFRNEATNQPRAPAEGGRAAPSAPKTPPANAGAAVQGTETATPAVSPAARGGEGTGEALADEADAFSVQVGAFADLSHANEQVSRLRAAGFEARVVESLTATRFRFQVRSGRYGTREEAARQAGLLRAGGVAGQTVIVEPEKRRG